MARGYQVSLNHVPVETNESAFYLSKYILCDIFDTHFWDRAYKIIMRALPE